LLRPADNIIVDYVRARSAGMLMARVSVLGVVIVKSIDNGCCKFCSVVPKEIFAVGGSHLGSI